MKKVKVRVGPPAASSAIDHESSCIRQCNPRFLIRGDALENNKVRALAIGKRIGQTFVNMILSERNYGIPQKQPYTRDSDQMRPILPDRGSCAGGPAAFAEMKQVDGL